MITHLGESICLQKNPIPLNLIGHQGEWVQVEEIEAILNETNCLVQSVNCHS